MSDEYFEDCDCIMFWHGGEPESHIALVGEIYDNDTVEFNFVITSGDKVPTKPSEIEDGYFPFDITLSGEDVEKLIVFLQSMKDYKDPDPPPTGVDTLFLDYKMPRESRRK